MLRDVFSGVTLAAVTGALYALGMFFGPANWNSGDGAWDLLVLVGIMLSASGFFAELLGSRLNRACAKPARRLTSVAGASTKAFARERSG
jgi:hypothetical protein